MKKLFSSLVAVLLAASLFSQSAPGTFKYQAVIRNASGAVKVNTDVSIDVVLLRGSATGDIVYTETHTATTNAYGLVSLNIGSGTPVDFAKINWANGPYFIQILVDGNEMGTSQLLSVPYALYAEKANVPGVAGPMGPPGPAGEGGSGSGGTDSIQLTSPNGKVWALKVDNNGIVSATASQFPKVIDVDGYSYDQVKIGTQTWLKQNLRTTKFNDGTPILIADNAVWAALIADTVTPACGILGDSVYYNWQVANTPGKNPCPVGFHVPSKAEWGVLAAYAGGTLNGDATAWEGAAAKLKSVAAGGTDDFGFKGELLGARDGGNGSYNLGWGIARWWARGPRNFGGKDKATEIGLWNGNNNLSVGAWYWNGGENLRCVKGELAYDADGNDYTTVKIGNQTWLKENLRATKFNDGTPILNATDDLVWKTLVDNKETAAFGFKNGDKSIGAFYNWQVANTPGKNPCPQGYHVPSKYEWRALFTYIGTSMDAEGIWAGAGQKLLTLAAGGTDEYGFSASFTAIRDGGNGSYPDWSLGGVVFWTSDQLVGGEMGPNVGIWGTDVEDGAWYWNSGYNVRCMK